MNTEWNKGVKNISEHDAIALNVKSTITCYDSQMSLILTDIRRHSEVILKKLSITSLLDNLTVESASMDVFIQDNVELFSLLSNDSIAVKAVHCQLMAEKLNPMQIKASITFLNDKYHRLEKLRSTFEVINAAAKVNFDKYYEKVENAKAKCNQFLEFLMKHLTLIDEYCVICGVKMDEHYLNSEDSCTDDHDKHVLNKEKIEYYELDTNDTVEVLLTNKETILKIENRLKFIASRLRAIVGKENERIAFLKQMLTMVLKKSFERMVNNGEISRNCL